MEIVAAVFTIPLDVFTILGYDYTIKEDATMSEDIQTVWVLKPKPSCPIGYTDLLVYSYLAKRDRFGGKTPTNVAVSKATGLTEKTVASSIDRLRAAGFVAQNRPVHQTDHFFSRGGSRVGCHWVETVGFYACYVRAEGSPLSTSDAMVYSYLRHLFDHDNRPKRLSYAYIANGVCMKEATIPDIFKRLEKFQLFKNTSTSWGVTTKLADVQREWFMGKLSTPQGDGPSLEDYTPDIEALYALKNGATISDNEIAPDTVSGIMNNLDLVVYLQDQFAVCDFREEEYEDIIEKIRREEAVPKAKWDRVRDTCFAVLDRRRSKAHRPSGSIPVRDRQGDSGSTGDPNPLGTTYRPPTEAPP